MMPPPLLLTSHRSVGVARPVDTHSAHVGPGASLSVLMAAVGVNLKYDYEYKCRVTCHCFNIFLFILKEIKLDAGQFFLFVGPYVMSIFPFQSPGCQLIR